MALSSIVLLGTLQELRLEMFLVNAKRGLTARLAIVVQAELIYAKLRQQLTTTHINSRLRRYTLAVKQPYQRRRAKAAAHSRKRTHTHIPSRARVTNQ